MRYGFMLAMGLLGGACLAFSPAVTQSGHVTLEIPEQPAWTALDTPVEVPVRVANGGDTPLVGTVTIGLTDAWRVAGEPQQAVNVPPGETVTLTFPIGCGAGTYSALYPIHATLAGQQGGQAVSVHTVLVVEAKLPPAESDPAAGPLVVLPGITPLSRTLPTALEVVRFSGESYAVAPRQYEDPLSKAYWRPGLSIDRGEVRNSISLHPPWAGGVQGQVRGVYALELPRATPITFESGLAIRDSNPGEPLSDGVTFIVQVRAGGQVETVAETHTAAKVWEPLTADLSRWAGQSIELLLVGDPGPAHNTNCDTGYWGHPWIRVGAAPPPESPAARQQRAAQALRQARAARQGETRPGSWQLTGPAGTAGAAVVPGPRGMTDAQIAFSNSRGEVVFDGFEVQVDGSDLGEVILPDPQPAAPPSNDRQRVMAQIHGRPIPIEAHFTAAAGALNIAWSMPGVTRDRRGEPRFTRLALGPASDETHRFYFGHGHVLEGTPAIDLAYGGFRLSTRFIGVEYRSGLALVTATDPVPDRLEHNQAQHRTSLVAHHDTTFTLVPSDQGAFAAARVWRLQSKLPASPDVETLRGKMCLDQWGGDYGEAARGLALATAYGLDEAVFVKHVWQRWGYDYRLPDIFPPAGDRADFDAMVTAAKANGRLFALHDNYIDLYPDADGFSYDLVGFDANGQPRKAWFNKGRQAQSYKWHPDRFQPFLERNLPLIRDAFAPTAYFIDVWSAGPGVDQYDREGNFSSQNDDLRSRAEAFQRVREVLGAATISEAGHDGLVGSLAAAQADHPMVDPGGGQFVIKADYAQWDRVPWFDMGHHGRFILYAGGLGNRYQAALPTPLHGYGSDDYLSLTVLGGRTPMCDGPFSRRAVSTYWLLQPLCNALEHQEMLAHQFDGDTVRRQQVTWSDGKVSVNRGAADWTVNGQVLPEYGFTARAGEFTADISRRDGQITASSQAPGIFFADARPPDRHSGLVADIAGEMRSFEQTGPREFTMTLQLDVEQPVADSVRLFVHLTGQPAQLPGWEPNADILFQANHDLPNGAFARPGHYTVTIRGTLPERLLPGELGVQYGLWDPAKGGARLAIRALSATSERYDGGAITVAGTGDATHLTWAPHHPAATADRDNTARRIIDFGPLATNTACRLLYDGPTWRLLLLPGSAAATVILKLDQLGAAGRTVAGVDSLTTDGTTAGPGQFTQEGNTVTLTTADQAFGYQLRFAEAAEG